MTTRVAQRSEINVTPFVDVMLVLLIIFMVAAPLAVTNIPLIMPPPGQATPQVMPVFVSLQKDGSIHVGTQRLGEAQGDWRSLLALLREKSGGNLGAPVFVRADRDVNYGDVVRLFDELRGAGYRNVSVVTEDPGD
ncbi:MAG: hypothetical protein GC190_12515 [Alphaproteobacteria bacterium]|nr:hypothetical protein [Alphaproteobacteria bacterium]